METRVCIYCSISFLPNKYSTRQKVCSSPVCQKKRQQESMRAWRQKNPNYFKYDESKGPVWLETQRKRSRVWREKNPEKIKLYRHTHQAEYRRYMKEYMRRYRETKKVSVKKPPSPPPAPPPQL